MGAEEGADPAGGPAGGAGGRTVGRRSRTKSHDLRFEEAYEDLRRVARNWMQGERRSHTLQATALVHEVYLRLAERDDVAWKDRTRLLSVAARIMRNVLVDHARARGSLRRGGGRAPAPLVGEPAVGSGADAPPCLDLLALDEAIDRLSAQDARAATIVELRYFGGLTTREIASRLGVSTRQVERDWEAARAWLHRAMS